MVIDPRADRRPPETGPRTGSGRPAAHRRPAAPPRRERRGRRAARMLVVPVSGAVLGLAIAACLAPRSLAVGQQAPGFSLPQLTPQLDPQLSLPGQRIALSDYAGRPVILSFFASWSPPCRAQTALLAHFYRVRHGQLPIIGVDSRDDRAAALRLLRQSGVTYPVASDPAQVVAGRYRVPGLPATYFLNARHQVVLVDLGRVSRQQLLAGLLAMNGGEPAGFAP